MKKILLTSFLSFKLLFIFGQWLNIPNPNINDDEGTPHVAAARPLANGKILYGIDHASMGEPGYSLYFGDDFNHLTRKLFSYSTLKKDMVLYLLTSWYGYKMMSSVSNADGTNPFVFFTDSNFYVINHSFSLDIKPSSFCLSDNYVYNTCVSNGPPYFIRTLQSNAANFHTGSFPQYYSIWGIAFVNDSTGCFLAASGPNYYKKFLVRTTDYGNSWSEIYCDSVNAITSFFFTSDSTGYITKNNGSVYKTTNGGNSWTSLSIPTNTTLNCIRFASDTLGYIGGNSGFLAKTTDGGQTWTIENSGTTADISDIYTFGSVAYFSTTNVSDGLFKNSAKGNGNIKVQQVGKVTYDAFDIFPNPSGGSITVCSPTDAKGPVSFRIADALGRDIYEKAFDGAFFQTIDIKNLPNGMYIVNFRSGHTSISKKLVLKKD